MDAELNQKINEWNNSGLMREYEWRRPDGMVLDRLLSAPNAVVYPQYPIEAIRRDGHVGPVAGPYDVWVRRAGDDEWQLLVPDAQNLRHGRQP